MTQPYVALTDGYRLRIQKHGTEDPSDTWFNEYDIMYPPGVLPTPTDALITDFLNYEQALHYSDVVFDQAIISDYHVGSAIGHPSFEIAVPFAAGTVGLQPAALTSLAGQGGGAIGGEVVLMVKKNILNRRRGGRNFYRGCLQKNDMSAEAGGEWSTPVNTQFPAQFAAHARSHITQYLATGADAHHFVLVSAIRSPGTPPHLILSFATNRVQDVQLVWPQVFTNKISRKSSR